MRAWLMTLIASWFVAAALQLLAGQRSDLNNTFLGLAIVVSAERIARAVEVRRG